jgi:anti-sigma factor RsiW
MNDTSSRTEPTCAEVEQLLPLVADGALDAEADPVLFAHLGQCAECQEALARHDLITLAIGQGAAASAAPRLAVIHYRLPRMVAWASAAVLMLGLGGTAWWMRGAPQTEPLVADREIIHVTVPGDATGNGYYLIRNGDSWQRVDPGRLDGDRPADASATRRDSAPVGYRY